MDFDLDDEQRAVLEAIEGLLAEYAGPARAIALAAAGDYDHSLDVALEEAGFFGLAQEIGTLEGLLLVEAVARRAGVSAIATGVLVRPLLGERESSAPIAIMRADHVGPVRYAAQAGTLVVLDGKSARCIELEAGLCAPMASNFGYPMGRVPAELIEGGHELTPGTVERLRDAWRLGLAGESVGCMESCLNETVDYLKERRQFGRAIGSFQGVQHRLAECAIQVEASRWLTREAAYLSGQGNASEAIATAAAFALDSAGQVFAETHQLSGAIGFTREHDLHVWSMRLQALRQELGGVGGHRRALVEARWGRIEA